MIYIGSWKPEVIYKQDWNCLLGEQEKAKATYLRVLKSR